MKHSALFLIVLLLLVSCFKKMNYTEELNTNIYDSNFDANGLYEYAGQFYSADTLDPNVYLRFRLAKDFSHGTSDIRINAALPGVQDKQFKNFVNYPILNPTNGAEFCFTLSIVSADSIGNLQFMHPYTECVVFKK